MVTTTNKLYYCGLNPGTLRTLLSSHKRKEQRNHAAAAGIPQSEIVFDEEKDHSTPVTINTAHLAGEIVKVDVATTHLAVLTSAGMVYTWGLGKSGQLVRPDDDQRTLELIEVEDKMFIASDIACGGDCTFVVDKESSKMFGCGFNSSGQLGKLQTDDDSAVMTIKTKKRVVKVRQPSNIYLRLREIGNLPKPSKDVVNLDIEPMSAPSSVIMDQDLLEWFLKTFKNSYEPKVVADMCLEFENHAGAALIHAMLNNQENALKFSLCVQPDNKMRSASLIEAYLENAEKENTASAQQAVRFLRVVIDHWSKFGLLNSDLEKVLVPYQTKPPWNIFLNCALKEIIASADESAKWIASNLTPLFILTAIKESKNGLICGSAPQASSPNPSPTVNSSAFVPSASVLEQVNDASVNGSSSLESSAVIAEEEIDKTSGVVNLGASEETGVDGDS